MKLLITFSILIISTNFLYSDGVGVYNKKACVDEHPLTKKGIMDLLESKKEMTKISEEIKNQLYQNEKMIRISGANIIKTLQNKNRRLELAFARNKDDLRILLGKQSKDLHEGIMKDIMVAIKDLMKSKNIDLVLPKSDFMAYSESIDLTNDIILKIKQTSN